MERKNVIIAALIGATVLAGCAKVSKQPPVYPRKAFFGNPDKSNVQISPDGKRIAFLAPSKGVMNVWVAPADKPKAAVCVTADTVRGIRIYFWAHTNNHVVYRQDDGGDENWAVHAVNVETKDDKNLTPIAEILDAKGKPILLPTGKKMRPAAFIQEVSYKFPEEILIGLNDRDPQFHDLYRVNLLSGERKLELKNDAFAGFVTDDMYQVRFSQRMTPEGGMDFLQPDGKGKWKPFLKIGRDDMLSTGPLGFDKSGNVLFLVDSRNRNTAALTAMNLATEKTSVLAEDSLSDIQDVLIHPTEKNVQAAASNYTRSEWKVLDPAIQPDMDFLKNLCDGELYVTSRSLDDKAWIVLFVKDDGPVRYYRYDRDKKSASFLFTNRKELEGLKLAKMHPVVIDSRDGNKLVSYLSLPPWEDIGGRPAKPLPMVLNVHGGPWGRDTWGLDGEHQWLANRGYAVLSVNFRASTGFGKAFTNAGDLEWAGKMHDDLIDAVRWAVKNNVAIEDKIAIMGGSYGGYSTLVGLTFTPDVFACGVDIVGPSNLKTLLETIPPYWKPMFDMFATRVGDPRTAAGRELLKSRSPLTFADRIVRPLLIGQGANDPRVKQAEADQIVKAMQAKGIPVTYVLYPDEGHGFARPENRLSFYAVSDLFLAGVLGGRSEPIGADFKNSSVTVPAGVDRIPGLAEALGKK
jgi:dipeptidyl aminopeptidase/acylaminoacyl peptidase